MAYACPAAIAEPFRDGNVSFPTKESGMRVDLCRGSGRNRLLSTCQATLTAFMILITCVSCSTRTAEMREPSYRGVEPVQPFASRLSDEENRQLVQRRSDARPNLQHKQHRIPPPPRIAKVHVPDTTGTFALRRGLEKPTLPRLPDAEQDQLFQEFLEWRKRQTDIP
jgi:hypothetical protein